MYENNIYQESIIMQNEPKNILKTINKNDITKESKRYMPNFNFYCSFFLISFWEPFSCTKTIVVILFNVMLMALVY